jgi:hypothetical protein
VLSRDVCDFRQYGRKTLILTGFEKLLHPSQKSQELQQKIKPFLGILQVFGHISAQDSTKAIALRLFCSSFSIPRELKGAIAHTMAA